MTREEKIARLKEIDSTVSNLDNQIKVAKGNADYYNALQLALKLVLNGSYGALAAKHFVMFINHVAGTITAQGRDLTQTMNNATNKYFHEMWHLDKELHKNMRIKDVTQISSEFDCSVYCDTDSVFVGFDQLLNHCTWRNLILNEDFLSKFKRPFIIYIHSDYPLCEFNNPNYIGLANSLDELASYIKNNPDVIIVSDGAYIKDRELNKLIKDREVIWNWAKELDFILGLDKYRFAKYYLDLLEQYAESFGVKNTQDFELEKISESSIMLDKKKYVLHLAYEDGIYQDRLKYIMPKGIDIVRSSTPLFARSKLTEVVNFLFSDPKKVTDLDIVKLLKKIKQEYKMCIPDKMDDICVQSSCSNYDEHVISEEPDDLEVTDGTHYAVRAAVYYNSLLTSNPEYREKYDFIRSGDKVKIYDVLNPIDDSRKRFAFLRGSFPYEFAPQIDVDTMFNKVITSPINKIVVPLGMPEITQRLTVVQALFSFSEDDD
jgi:DNA polymerase elongation subunit (family B)